MLISYGDFLENNSQLPAASYTEEIWALQLREKLVSTDDIPNRARLAELVRDWSIVPTMDEALSISETLGIPLHPRYSLYWDSISGEEVMLLVSAIRDAPAGNILFDEKVKDILEKLSAYHSIQDNRIIFDDPEQESVLRRLLAGSAIDA